MDNKRTKEKKKYIKISSSWVSSITLPPEKVAEHLQEYYFSSLRDWLENWETLTLQVVEMTESEYLKLPEWSP